MKKLVAPILGVLLLGLAAAPSSAGVKFEIEEGFNFFSDDRVEGQNRHVGVSFGVSDSISVGVYQERADLQLDGDVGATPPNTTGLEYDAMAVRVEKQFSEWLSAGIDLGSAQIQQGSTSGAFAATAALNQNKPFVGVHGKVSHSVNVKDKVSTVMSLSLGYRFLDLNDVAITGAPAGESTLDDLNALIVGVGFGFKF